MIVYTAVRRQQSVYNRMEIPWDAFANRLSQPKDKPVTPEQYAAMNKDDRANTKDVGGYIPGELPEGGRRLRATLLSRTALTLDADHLTPGGLTDLLDRLDMLGIAAAAHTTCSHTPETPRLRVVLPLAAPVTPEMAEYLSRVIASRYLGPIDLYDTASFSAAQMMFWPVRLAGGDFLFRQFTGEPIAFDDYADDDWQDHRTWPRASCEADLPLTSDVRQLSDPREKAAPVGAFCRAYGMSEAIATYLPDLYTPCGRDRYTYAFGTSAGGALVYDDTFLYSRHESDPLNDGHSHNAFDAVRISLYHHLDHGTPAGTRTTDLPSFKAMCELCADDARYQAEALRDTQRDFASDPAGPSAPDPPTAHTPTVFGDLTDLGWSRRFARSIAGSVLWTDLGWAQWEGTHWQTGLGSHGVPPAIRDQFNRFADDMQREAREVLAVAPKDKAAEALSKSVTSLRQSGKQNGIIQMSASCPCISIKEAMKTDKRPWLHPEQFDPDNDLLNTPGGIVDLMTGETRPHDPAKRCHHTAAFTPRRMPTPLWDTFISRVTCGDEKFADFLQIIAGFAASGEVSAEKIFFLVGDGANGKSTFVSVLQKALHDYAVAVAPSLLIQDKNSDAERDCVTLYRKRLAVVNETPQGGVLRGNDLKRLTGGDMLHGRYLYNEGFDFKPTHTIFLTTNAMPRIDLTPGTGESRRILVLPFSAKFKDSEQVGNYDDKLLEAEGPGIMQWIVDGAVLFYACGCLIRQNILPDCVKEASAAYMQDSDWVGRFVQDNIEYGDDYTVRGSTLFQRFTAWADAENIRSRPSRTHFTRLIRQRLGPAVTYNRNGGYGVLTGVRLTAEADFD